MHGRNRSHWCGINQIQHAVNSFQKITHTLESFGLFHRLRALVEFAQIGARTKARLHFAIDNENPCFSLQIFKSCRKLFQLFKRKGTQFVARSPMQRQFDDAILQSPRQPFGPMCKCLSSFHAVFAAWYISSTSLFICAAITSRFSFPLTVSIPFSMENASDRTQNARTCL